MKNPAHLLFTFAILLLLGACAAAPDPLPDAVVTAAVPPGTAVSIPTTAPSLTPAPTATAAVMPTEPAPTVTPEMLSQPVGPDDYPPGVNPLTGLPVQDPAALELPPALMSISNSPLTARPQVGLSYSPLVFEMYIGEGASRFLALFYGDFPPETVDGQQVRIGPIRSGRLPYERLRLQYKGFLVFASASSRVLPYLDEYTIVYGTSQTDPNTARITVTDLKRIAADEQPILGSTRLVGQRFDPRPPQDGKPAQSLWLPYHFINQVFWQYDTASGKYLRSQDQMDGKTIVPSVDALTDQQLAFDNVIVLFANQLFSDRTYFNIDFNYITRLPALLFRNGKMQEIYWTTGNDAYEKQTGRFRPIRFIDADRNPIPLKPGQTWVEIVPLNTPYGETLASTNYQDLLTQTQPGSGNWAVYFTPPEPAP